HRVARRLDRCAPAGGLEDAELRLELGRMTAERLERLAHALGVETVARARDVLEARQGGQAGCGGGLSWFLCHLRLLSSQASRDHNRPRRKYDCWIGRNANDLYIDCSTTRIPSSSSC